MSNISSSKKIHCSWKVSDSSKIYPNEVSMRDSKILLPERFSPSKSNSKEFRILNSSKDRLNLLKINSSRSPSVTPNKREIFSLNSSQHLKDSIQLPDSPTRLRIEGPPRFLSKESLVLKSLESDSPLPRFRGPSEVTFDLLKSQQEANLNAVHQIKIDFCSFKEEIWRELMDQRQLITKIGAQMAKKIEEMRFVSNKNIEESLVVALKNSDVAQNAEVAKCLNQFQSILEKKYSELRLDLQSAADRVISPPATPVQNPFAHTTFNQGEGNEKTPILKLEQIEKIPEKRRSPLDKCNQIAETIGILSQINSSPVNNKAKSIEKLSIEDYKQKLISICKSNELLMKQSPKRAQPLNEEQSKLKGNFKLDKFYNAIEKLKEEVNEIRNINDMKQIKKLKILKVNE